MSETCGSCGSDRRLSAPERCLEPGNHEPDSPRLSVPDRESARKALWDLRAEVTRAIDDVMVRAATYGSLHQGLAAMEARIGRLRLSLAAQDAQPVPGPPVAARPSLRSRPRLDDPQTWPADSRGAPVAPPWDLGEVPPQ